MDKISFVILSYNRPTETVEVIKNLIFEVDDLPGFQKELIVVNNGSPVDYIEVEKFIQENKLTLKYINNLENLGVSGGRNIGIRHATGKYVVFIDDDAVFEGKDILTKIHSKFSSDETLGIIGFGVYNYFTHESDHPVKDKNKLKENEFYNNIFWGCGFVVLNKVFKEVGLFDDKFFYGMEEYDLSYRTMDRGYKILFTKEIAVLHKVSPAGREKQIVKYSRMFVNKCLIAYRYLPWLYVVSHIFMWCGFLILKTRCHIPNFFKSLIKLIREIKKSKRNKISENTLLYLKSVSARLTY